MVFENGKEKNTSYILVDWVGNDEYLNSSQTRSFVRRNPGNVPIHTGQRNPKKIPIQKCSKENKEREKKEEM